MRRAHAVAVTALAALLVSLWAGRVVLDPPAPGWDEGVHLENALGAARALRAGRKAFLLWLDAPSYYPFVHSLLVAVAWSATGPVEWAARLPALLGSLLTLAGTALLAWGALPGDERERSLVASLAVLLVASGPELLRLTPLVMLDTLGAAATVWTAWAWVEWLRRPGWSRAAAVVAGTTVAFFVKYNYGLVLAAALVLHGWLGGAGFRRLFQAVVLAAPVALLWLYQEPAKKMALLSEYVWNRVVPKPAVVQWTFPVVSFARDHTVHTVLGAVVLAGFVLAWRRLRASAPAGIVLLLPALMALAQALSSAQLARYVLPGVPLLAVAAAAALAPPLAAVRAGPALAAAGLCLPFVLPPGRILDPSPAWRERTTLRELRAWSAPDEGERPVWLVGGFAWFPPSLGRYEGVRRAHSRTGRLDLDAPPAWLAPPPAYRWSRECLEPVGTAAAGEFLDRALGKGGAPSEAIVLFLPPGSPFRGFDWDCYNAWQEDLALALVGRAGAPLGARDWPGRVSARRYRLGGRPGVEGL